MDDFPSIFEKTVGKNSIFRLLMLIIFFSYSIEHQKKLHLDPSSENKSFNRCVYCMVHVAFSVPIPDSTVTSYQEKTHGNNKSNRHLLQTIKAYPPTTDNPVPNHDISLTLRITCNFGVRLSVLDFREEV